MCARINVELATVINEIRLAAQKVAAMKTASLAKLESEKKSVKKIADEAAGIWAGLVFCIGIFPALFSSGGEVEVATRNMALLIFLILLGSGLIYAAGSIKTGSVQNRIDNLRTDLKDFQKEIDNDVNLFDQKLREWTKQRKEELEKIRKQREKHEREEAVKKKVLGYLLAYKSAKTPELAKRFKLTKKQTEKILSELQSMDAKQ